MSEKRFIVEYGENNLPFFADLEEHRDMSIKEVVDLLNEMFEKLDKKQEKSVELFFKYKKLQEENEQLKCINEQLEERLEESGIGIVLKMDCDNNE